MVEVCFKCGLPKDLCVCDDIAKEDQIITVKIERRKFGKRYTVIEGLSKDIDTGELVKKLKSKFACGGTDKNNSSIELQGDHKARMKEALIALGFLPETIQVK